MRQLRPLVERQIALLREAAALNLQIGALADQTSHIDALWASPDLDMVYGGSLMFYLRGLESFRWPEDAVR